MTEKRVSVKKKLVFASDQTRFPVRIWTRQPNISSPYSSFSPPTCYSSRPLLLK